MMAETWIAGDQVRAARPDLRWDSGSDAQLLTCLSLLGRDDHRPIGLGLVARLRALIRGDGTIRAGRVRISADLDHLSGSVLCAPSTAGRWLAPDDPLAGIDLAQTLDFYRRCFDLVHPWGMVWWHGRAWSTLADRVPGAGPFAFSLVDSALDRRSETTGALLVHDVEPARASFLTACVLEGVAAAWRLARSCGDSQRAERYADAWRRGIASWSA
jgi:hypothetical protein